MTLAVSALLVALALGFDQLQERQVVEAAVERTSSAIRSAVPPSQPAEAEAEPEPALPWLRVPEPPRLAEPLAAVSTQAGTDFPRFARAVSRSVPIYNSARSGRFEIGALRLGALVRARTAGVSGTAPCDGGWVEVKPGGYACVADGLRVDDQPPPVQGLLPGPPPRAVLPYRYVKVNDRSAFRYDRAPTAAQREAIADGDAELATELGARPLDGAYFLAIEDEDTIHGTRWLRTLEGNYVRATVTDPVKPPTLLGTKLSEEHALPLAFVVEDGAPVRAAQDDSVTAHAPRYARVALQTEAETPDGFVRTADGHLLRTEDVRVVDRHPRPGDVPASARWVHIDLAEQTLVAYEGDDPVYATLVASGKKGRQTPNGVYQVRYKYLSTTMRGEDPTGPYEVQEVPWTMYYDGPYALHGAYWHDAFGAPRSHGCTNISPADARWLFHFTTPDVPPGWHVTAELGTYVEFTGSGQEPEPFED